MKKVIISLLLLLIPISINAATLEDFQNALAGVGMSAGVDYKDEFVYTYFFGGTKENPINLKSSTTDRWLNNGYRGITSSGYIYGFKPNPGIRGSFSNKFGVYCETFVQLMIRHAAGTNLDYYRDFQKINLNEIKKGDLINFNTPDPHVAIYISGSNGKYYVAHSTGRGVEYVYIDNRNAIGGMRLKESSLSKLNDNLLMASYDFHDRLDDQAPVISQAIQTENSEGITLVATDFKHYELADRSDLKEPENSGIVYYQVTKSDMEPTENWKIVAKTTSLNMKTPSVGAGKWYVWVKDVGGNVAFKEVSIKAVGHSNPNQEEPGSLSPSNNTTPNSSNPNNSNSNSSNPDAVKSNNPNTNPTNTNPNTTPSGNIPGTIFISNNGNNNSSRMTPLIAAQAVYDAACNALERTEAYKIIKNVFRGIQILGPILAIVLSGLDFLQAIPAKDEKEMQKAISNAPKRIISAILLLILPWIVNLILESKPVSNALQGNVTCSVKNIGDA